MEIEKLEEVICNGDVSSDVRIELAVNFAESVLHVFDIHVLLRLSTYACHASTHEKERTRRKPMKKYAHTNRLLKHWCGSKNYQIHLDDFFAVTHS